MCRTMGRCPSRPGGDPGLGSLIVQYSVIKVVQTFVMIRLILKYIFFCPFSNTWISFFIYISSDVHIAKFLRCVFTSLLSTNSVGTPNKYK